MAKTLFGDEILTEGTTMFGDPIAESAVAIEDSRQPLDPDEAFERAGAVWDISVDMELPISTTGSHYELLTDTPYDPAEAPVLEGDVPPPMFGAPFASRMLKQIIKSAGLPVDEMMSTQSPELALTVKEIQELPWFKKLPEGTGFAIEKFAEFKTLGFLFKSLGLTKVLGAFGKKLAAKVVGKELAAMGGKVALLQQGGWNTFRVRVLSGFLQALPENVAFLSAWRASEAARRGEPIGPAAMSGAKWGVGFSLAAPLIIESGSALLSTKGAEKMITKLQVKFPKLADLLAGRPEEEIVAATFDQMKKAGTAKLAGEGVPIGPEIRFVDLPSKSQAVIKAYARKVRKILVKGEQQRQATEAYWAAPGPKEGILTTTGQPTAKPTIAITKPTITPTEAVEPAATAETTTKPTDIAPKAVEAKPGAVEGEVVRVTIEKPEISGPDAGKTKILAKLADEDSIIFNPKFTPQESFGLGLQHEASDFIVGSKGATQDEMIAAALHETGHLEEGVMEIFSSVSQRDGEELTAWQTGIDRAKELGFDLTPELIIKIQPRIEKHIGLLEFPKPTPTPKPKLTGVSKDYGFDIEKPKKPKVQTKAVTRKGFVDLTPLAEAGPQIKSVSDKASKLVSRFGGLDSEVRKTFIEYEEQLRELPNVVAKDSIEKFGKLTPEQEDILQKHREDPKKFPDLPEELKPVSEVLKKDIEEGGKRFEKLGYTADWPNQYIDRLEKKLQREQARKDPAQDKIQSLKDAIEEARDLRYLHHFYEKEAAGKRIIGRFKKTISGKPKGLIGRKIPTLEKAKELGLKPAPLAVSHSHFMHELARAEAANDLITAINSNPELSLPEDLAPEEWVRLDERIFPASVQHRAFVNEEGKPIHIRKFRKYPIPIAEALEEIAYTRNFSALERAYDKLNFSLKIIGFYNPVIMAKNDAVQLWRASGLKGAAPLLLPEIEIGPISIKPPKAVQIFAEKGPEYQKLRKGGLFNNVVNYTPPVTELSDLMLKHIRETSGEKAARIAGEWLNPGNFFKNLRKFNEATTWNMDEIMRIAAYEAVKDSTMLEGMTDFEKIEWVNDAMVNYGKLPKETKRWLNKAIFTPSYRVGNFRYFWGQVAKHPWRMKGPLLRTVGYKMFIRWGLPAIISAAILWKTGEERDVRTEKGYKLIVTNPDTNTDTVYSLSDPLLEGVKITQRPIRQTLALNLAAVPALIVRASGGPRFRQSEDKFGEFFKLGTPIYRDILNWRDPDKTVANKLLTQFAIAFVYTRRAREANEENVVEAMAKTLAIWTDWKEQAADLQQMISGRKYYLGPGGKFGRLLRKFKVEQDIDRDEIDIKVDKLLGKGETGKAIEFMLKEGRYESAEGISGKLLKSRAPVFYYWQVMPKKDQVEFMQWLRDNNEYSGNEVDELLKALDKSVNPKDR